MKDYLAAVDYMKEKPYVDGDRIGAIGASYGGFSVYWLAGHHEGRFAALVAHAGIFNIESQYLETEEMWFADFDLGGPYWDKENAVAQRNLRKFPAQVHRQMDSPDSRYCRRTRLPHPRIAGHDGIQRRKNAWS